MNKLQYLLFFTLITTFCYSQNDTSSPYSLYGLGVENKTATSGLTGLGNTGLAQSKSGEINLFNPASLGNVELKTFLFEFGLNGISSKLKTTQESDNTTDFNISHVVMAFPVTPKLGLSFGLLPYTKVGYDIDVESYIEGSEDTYINRVTGSGGLNKVYVAGGYKFNDRLSVGLDLTYLFGSINQENTLFYESLVNISDMNQYNGFKLKAGLQYNIFNEADRALTLGGIIELPTTLSGDQVRTSYKTSVNGSAIFIDFEEETELDDFEFPFVYGIGVTSKINKNLTASVDFTNLFWDETDQYQDSQSYSNQYIYGLGAEYIPEPSSKYFSNVSYRFGFNYNSGFLTISDQEINSYFISAGLGLPLSNRATLNLSYSYGSEGTVSNHLIQEKYHKLTLNLSFIGNWFNKSKYN